jgi:hypothetical protein
VRRAALLAVLTAACAARPSPVASGSTAAAASSGGAGRYCHMEESVADESGDFKVRAICERDA